MQYISQGRQHILFILVFVLFEIICILNCVICFCMIAGYHRNIAVNQCNTCTVLTSAVCTQHWKEFKQYIFSHGVALGLKVGQWTNTSWRKEEKIKQSPARKTGRDNDSERERERKSERAWYWLSVQFWLVLAGQMWVSLIRLEPHVLVSHFTKQHYAEYYGFCIYPW